MARLEGPGKVRVETRVPGRWRITWKAPVRGRLVVAETWDPGWRAWIDGRPVAVERLDGILMAVPVGPGSGSIELRYHPDGFALGMVLSALGLCVLVAGAWQRAGRSESRPV